MWNRNGGWNKLNAKKWVTIVTLICTIIAVVLMTVFKCCFSDGNIGYDIALAIFGSALLGLIMSLVEYFSERKKAMEQFWIEAKRVLAQFRKAKYIYFDEPEEIVIGCIAENYYNKRAKKSAPGVVDIFGSEESHVYQEKYTQWMEENEPMLFTENHDIGNKLNQNYISKMENYEKTVNEVIDNYIELSKISLYELDSAYSNLNFIFSNKNIRLKAYNEIFNKIRTIKQKILEETYHFNLYKDNKGNFAVCMNKAIEVSKVLFTEEKKSEDAFDYVGIFQKEFDDIEESLETFRAKIYFRSKVESIERIPVTGRMMNFQDSTEVSNS